MKIKGSVEKLDLKKMFCISGILFGLLFLLRAYQNFFLTDPENGFFTDHSNITVPIFYILSVGTVFAVLILSYLTPVNGGEYIKKRDLPLAVSSLMFAMPLISQGIEGIKTFAGIMRTTPLLKDAIAAAGGNISVIAPVCSVLAAIALIINAVSFATGNIMTEKMRFLDLFPAAWAFFVTINYFKITVSYLKVGHLMLTIFADAFLMVFLFEYARFITGVGRKDAMWSFYSTGIISVGLLTCTEIFNVIAKFTVAGGKLIEECDFAAANLFAMIFVITAMAYAAKNTLAVDDTEPVEESVTEVPAEPEDVQSAE